VRLPAPGTYGLGKTGKQVPGSPAVPPRSQPCHQNLPPPFQSLTLPNPNPSLPACYSEIEKRTARFPVALRFGAQYRAGGCKQFIWSNISNWLRSATPAKPSNWLRSVTSDMRRPAQRWSLPKIGFVPQRKKLLVGSDDHTIMIPKFGTPAKTRFPGLAAKSVTLRFPQVPR
jgi:hypothetical protein